MSKQRKIRKIVLYLLIFILSAVVICALSNAPSPTAEAAFRRKEKQQMIGPAEIVEILDFEDNRYDHLLISRSEYGYTFFEWNDSNPDDGVLSYQPRSTGATLYCTKYNYEDMSYSQGWLPIFAFTDQPAVSAKLTLTTTQDSETITYSMDAKRSGAGYFLFRWKTTGLRGSDFWLVQQMITGEYSNYILEGTTTATLELYNTKGELVETHQFPTTQ